MVQSFPAFCHISDYGSDGFKYLHRMVAASSPLVVWAPSGVELDDRYQRGECPLDSSRFLDLVHAGHIQVVGRQWWLADRKARNALPRSESNWRPEFDGVLLSMLEEDSRLVAPERMRVRIMPPERGYAFADEQIGAPGEKIKNQALYRRALRLYHNGLIPTGNAEKAARKAAEVEHRNTRVEGQLRRRTIVREILRDARNHVDAVHMSHSTVPFWSIDDGQFIGLLEGREKQFEEERAELPPGSQEYFDDYFKQALELLGQLEKVSTEGRKDLRNPDHLLHFLGSDGHASLVRWLKFHSENVREMEIPDHKIRQYLIRNLRLGVENDLINRPIDDVLGLSNRTPFRLIQALNILVMLGPLAIDPTAPTSWADLGFFLVSVVENAIISKEYDGSQWPFLYAFGERPNQQLIKEMRDILDALPLDARTVHPVNRSV